MNTISRTLAKVARLYNRRHHLQVLLRVCAFFSFLALIKIGVTPEDWEIGLIIIGGLISFYVAVFALNVLVIYLKKGWSSSQGIWSNLQDMPDFQRYLIYLGTGIFACLLIILIILL